MAVSPNGIDVKIVASENTEWLVTLENHKPQKFQVNGCQITREYPLINKFIPVIVLWAGDSVLKILLTNAI